MIGYANDAIEEKIYSGVPVYIEKLLKSVCQKYSSRCRVNRQAIEGRAVLTPRPHLATRVFALTRQGRSKAGRRQGSSGGLQGRTTPVELGWQSLKRLLPFIGGLGTMCVMTDRFIFGS